MKYLGAFLRGADPAPCIFRQGPHPTDTTDKSPSVSFVSAQGAGFKNTNAVRRAPEDRPVGAERFDVGAARLGIAARVPRLCVGDVWHHVPTTGAAIEIIRLVPQEGLPWVMAHYRRLDGGEDLDPRTGAPAFIFGQRARP